MPANKPPSGSAGASPSRDDFAAARSGGRASLPASRLSAFECKMRIAAASRPADCTRVDDPVQPVDEEFPRGIP